MNKKIYELEMKEKAVKDLIKTCEEYFKKHKNKRMSLKKLDNLCNMSGTSY